MGPSRAGVRLGQPPREARRGPRRDRAARVGYRATLTVTAAARARAQEHLAADVPIVSVSKGLEVGSGRMMSELIPSALGRKQPMAFLSGPSFAKEVMDLRPTGVVAASKARGPMLR